jgi:hypothetical protein
VDLIMSIAFAEIPRKKFESKEDDAREKFWIVYNWKFLIYKKSSSFVMLVKSVRLWRARHVVQMEERRNIWRIFVGKSFRKPAVSRLPRIRGDNIKLNVT